MDRCSGAARRIGRLLVIGFLAAVGCAGGRAGPADAGAADAADPGGSPDLDLSPGLDLSPDLSQDLPPDLDLSPDPSPDLPPDLDLSPDPSPDLPPDPAPDAPGPADVPAPLDFGPWAPDATAHPFAATGFYRVDLQPDRWWLVTPDGRPFYSIGINAARPDGEPDRTTGERPYGLAVDALYPDHAAWADATAARLASWGFNTVGAWSDLDLLAPRMPYTVILYLSGADWMTGAVQDYFSPEFEARCAQIASATVAPRRDDPDLVGWFLDNEMHWGPDWRTTRTLLADYLALPEGAPGRAVAEAHAGDPSGFLALAAARYFEVAASAVRAADPNHLVLGSRFVSVLTPPEVAVAAGPWVDVVSVNWYVYVEGLGPAVQEAFAPVVPVDGGLRAFAELAGRPVLVTEFSFRAADAGLPNSYPPVYPVLATQAERADAFADQAGRCQASPWIVGHHWFQYTDEPPGGRFDGEDSNFGLVDNGDQPWEVLTARMAQVHAAAPHLAPAP